MDIPKAGLNIKNAYTIMDRKFPIITDAHISKTTVVCKNDLLEGFLSKFRVSGRITTKFRRQLQVLRQWALYDITECCHTHLVRCLFCEL
jgi:hypothetical protein